MALVTVGAPRFRISDDQNGYQIRIPVRRNWFIFVFLLCWLGGWTLGEGSAIGSLLKGKKQDGSTSFTLFWLGCWTLGGAFAFYTLASMLVGSEIIAVNGTEIALKSCFGKWMRSKEYELAAVKNLRVSTATYNNARFTPQSWMGYTANLAFDYGAKTYRFGTGLDEAEAQAIVDALQQRWPQLKPPGSTFGKV
jgi:hypothetical protein